VEPKTSSLKASLETYNPEAINGKKSETLRKISKHLIQE
jgi:hypothetical protein